METVPEVSVVVPSHGRPLRLRWLLNALEETDMERGRWEVVVVHDDAGDETEGLLRGHPLARGGTLRHRRLEPGTGSPARQRNVGWREAHAPLVAFTDDDCRPPATWLPRLLATALTNPGAVVQGAVRPDPDEAHLLHAAPHARSLTVEPPGPFAESANVLYPRELLERLGGFDERFPSAAGEDTDLMLRARAAGARYAGAPTALTYHAVDAPGLFGRLRSLPRWRHVAKVVRAHPQMREALTLGLFFKPSHAALPGVIAALPALVRCRPAVAVALALPWALAAAPRYGLGLRGIARSASELPGRLVLDVAEAAVLVRGSVEERTLVL